MGGVAEDSRLERYDIGNWDTVCLSPSLKILDGKDTTLAPERPDLAFGV